MARASVMLLARTSVTLVAHTSVTLVALALAGCAEPASERPVAPVAPRAAVVVEPPLLAIGETAWVEVAVTTPPAHRVAPLEPPEEVAGFWILDAETLPVEREAARAVHRTRFQVRARRTGHFVWPEQRIEAEDEDGARYTLLAAARPLEVRELSSELPGRSEPFGWRMAEPPGAGLGVWLPAAAGALAVLALGALFLAVRRIRAHDAERGTSAAADAVSATPGATARAALAALLAEAERNPRAAAGEASSVLRVWLAERRSLRGARCATTEELVEGPVPYVLERHWPELLAVLRELDAARFRRLPAAGEAALAPQVRATIARAEAFVRATLPARPSS